MGKRVRLTDDLLKEIAFLKTVAAQATKGRPDGKPGFALTAPGAFTLAFPAEPHVRVVARKLGIRVIDKGIVFAFRDASEAKAVAAQLAMLHEELARVGKAAGWEILPPPPLKKDSK